LAPWDQLVLLEPSEGSGHQGPQDQLDSKGLAEVRDLQDHQEDLGLLGQRVHLALRAYQAEPDLPVQTDQPDFRERQDHQGERALLAPRGLSDRQVPLVLLVIPDQPDHREVRDLPDTRVLLGLRDNLVQLDFLVDLDHSAQPDPLVRLVLPGPREDRES